MQLHWAAYVLLGVYFGDLSFKAVQVLIYSCCADCEWQQASCPCVQVARLVEPVTGPSGVPGRGESCCK